MGVFSEHLVGLIAKQVEERSLVVWYDPGLTHRGLPGNPSVLTRDPGPDSGCHNPRLLVTIHQRRSY